MSRFEKWLLWLSTVATFTTGAGYFWTKYMLPTPAAWAVVNHPLQPWFLRLHVLVAPVMVFALGGVILLHAVRHYQARRRDGRRTGITTGVCAVLMILTGYLVQVVTHVGWLAAVAYAHIGLGTLYVGVFVGHELIAAAGRRVSRTAAPVRPAPGGD